MKRKILAAIPLLVIVFCSHPGYAADPAQLTWVQMETQEEVRETTEPSNTSSSPKPASQKEGEKDVSADVKSEDGDYLTKAIGEIMKRRQEDDKLLTALLNKQKELEKAQKAQEEAQKRQEEARKKEEQQKLVENLTQTFQKQKDEDNQKLAEVLKVLTEQQVEQSNNVTALINVLKEEQSNRQQREKEQQVVLSEQAVSSFGVNNSVNSVQTAPAPAVNITPLQKTLKESIAGSTQDVTQAAFLESDATFFYTPGSIYKIYCQEGFVTDIRLQPGEEIQYIGGGDTVRWVIDQAQSGSGTDKTWHIYIKPMKTGLATNIIVSTDKHSYQLYVESTNWYTPIVNWTYPQEEKAAFYRAQALAQKHEQENLGEISLESLNFNYNITKGKSYDWTPTEVFDDGTKTYIKMPEVMSKGNAPVLFVKDGKNLALVNFRLKNGIYIVDRLFKEAELRSGKEIVRIKKAK